MNTEIAMLFILSFFAGMVLHDFISDISPDLTLFLRVRLHRLRFKFAPVIARVNRYNPLRRRKP